MSDAEIPHLVSSRLIMLILTFYRLPLFLISGAGLFFLSRLSLFLYLQHGFTPLHVVCRHGHEKIVEMLVTTGADVEVKDEVRRRLQV